jgi:hypothetical protein
MVSRHHGCEARSTQKWDKLKKDDVFGKGKFECSNCHARWTSGPERSKYAVEMTCHKCGKGAKPLDITRSTIRGPRKSKKPHHCELCETGRCRSFAEVAVPENRHISTGSTRSTITQHSDNISTYSGWTNDGSGSNNDTD